MHTSRDIAHAVSLFYAVRRIMRAKLGKGRKLDPTTWLWIETMKFISEEDKPRMKDIADYLSITAPSATSLVAGLMKKGFVAQAADTYDRRALRLVLTAKGKTELKKTITRGIRLFGGLFSALSNKELSAFVGALERIKGSSTER